MIRLVAVSKRYETASALDEVTLQFEQGERVALLGKSGSGKSTLLNLLGGLDRPSSGAIFLNDRDLATMSADELAKYRLLEVGIIFQAFNLIATKTAMQNVELPMIFRGVGRKERLQRSRLALEAVGLGHRLEHRPTQLSGGETQRVAIARALINEPRIVLADEPTGNLDSGSAERVMEILREQVARVGATLILVTHDEELARRHAGRVVRLQDGKVLGNGS
jgi:ABC-type lipoprotein export system ATPase subunit